MNRDVCEHFNPVDLPCEKCKEQHMNKPEFRVERGPMPEPEPFAIGMAKLLEREGRTVAAAELRQLHAQRDALLEALKTLVLATKDFSIGHYNEEVHDIALSKSRDAIKQAEEKA